ncbi:MAG: L-histidine N(alpha)-methyltransferase [Bacteroidetes bacterium]|nr:L-histidine N(alpha)-methyltransferase [Bacteroidota bacterium]
MSSPDTLPLLDFHPETESFRDEVLTGLRDDPKHLPSKFFYDERGSKLFDAICELDEYYLTRTELAIMKMHLGAMVDALGPRVRLVEYGSGSSLKTRLLLDHLPRLAGYVPIDISREHLLHAAEEIAAQYPDVPILPVCADYTSDYRLPDPDGDVERTVVYYPGSTVGNFTPDTARTFLTHMAKQVGPRGGLLIGVDLQKDEAVLRAAYNDAQGVTAAFNKNLLRRINRQLEADFDLDRFRHEAVYNAAEGRVEMYLVSESAQRVAVEGVGVSFEAGERILTEYSYKYTVDGFADLADRAGWSVETVWTDDQELFSVQYAERKA